MVKSRKYSLQIMVVGLSFGVVVIFFFCMAVSPMKT